MPICNTMLYQIIRDFNFLKKKYNYCVNFVLNFYANGLNAKLFFANGVEVKVQIVENHFWKKGREWRERERFECHNEVKKLSPGMKDLPNDDRAWLGILRELSRATQDGFIRRWPHVTLRNSCYRSAGIPNALSVGSRVLIAGGGRAFIIFSPFSASQSVIANCSINPMTWCTI